MRDYWQKFIEFLSGSPTPPKAFAARELYNIYIFFQKSLD